MRTKYSLFEKITMVAALFPLAYLAIIWKKIPDTVVTHYNASLQPDGTDNKSVLLLTTGLLAGISLLVFLLMKNIHRFDPKQRASAPSAGFGRLGIVIVNFFTVLNLIIIIAATSGPGVLQKTLYPLIGILFALIGNYMNNIKPNYFAGIRLPWTLSSDDNWRKTHHLAGKLWFWGGIVLVASSIFIPARDMPAVIIGIVIFLVIVPGVYSYRMFRSERKNRA